MPSEQINVDSEFLRDTKSAVVTAMEHSTQLSTDCVHLIENVVGSRAFTGDAANMANITIAEINNDLSKILEHGRLLAEHLGKTADVMEANEGESADLFRGVSGG
ncbi:hypothetical protein [[Mycobacterium] wendilense]|uniref:Uncharacterized protein n=1 Tax=[Mycobacterium] wendilense TaxID=3064284 RepID=A0ABN9NWJ9_9MYCO|nr:hypothetical protein [Mycolicibacterium sp. MU0050]CAJ1578400.1 hypothetical protein MU0050_000064 [Mycolicibacterium sp. MU0050]